MTECLNLETEVCAQASDQLDFVSQPSDSETLLSTLLDLSEKGALPGLRGTISNIKKVPSGGKGSKGGKGGAKAPASKLRSVVISSSAARSAAQCGSIRYTEGGKAPDWNIAKLFAKHMKMSDQTDFLERGIATVGVGTAGRVLALGQSGALPMGDLESIVIDVTPTVKGLTILDDPASNKELMEFLALTLSKRGTNFLKVVLYSDDGASAAVKTQPKAKKAKGGN
jgi:hypothetical protein